MRGNNLKSMAKTLNEQAQKKTNENNDHKTQDDLKYKVHRSDVHEIISNQQQGIGDLQREQPNRINIHENSNNQVMDLNPELLQWSVNNQEPQVTQKILNTILPKLHGQSDFQICISNLDNTTYQQLQNTLQNLPQLNYTSSVNNQELEIDNESINLIKQMRDEFIVSINGQSENDVSQQIRWQIVNSKCFNRLIEIAHQINLRIEPIAQRYQYKLIFQFDNKHDKRIFKNRKNIYEKFSVYLDSIIILTYQCQNLEEAQEISRIQKDTIIMKQLYEAFETNNVIIDYIKSNQIEKNEFYLIFAIVYNYFDIPINQLQESFNQKIQNFKKWTLGYDDDLYEAQQSQEVRYSSEINTIRSNNQKKQQNQIIFPKIENRQIIQQPWPRTLQYPYMPQLPPRDYLQDQISQEMINMEGQSFHQRTKNL